MSMFVESMKFVDVMNTVVNKYQIILKKYFSHEDRVTHIQNLNLKDQRLYTSEVLLYELGYKILDHLSTITAPKMGYYAYSGMEQFVKHLKDFLKKYQVDSKRERVVHISQLASSYMIKAAQIFGMSDAVIDKYTSELEECQQMLCLYASSEQIDLYRDALNNLLQTEKTGAAYDFYCSAKKHFVECLSEREALDRVA